MHSTGPCRNKSAMRWWWWKNSAQQKHRQHGCHAVANQVPGLEFEFQMDSLVYTHIADHMYIQFGLAQNSTCTRPSRKQLFHKFGSVCNLKGICLSFHKFSFNSF